MAIAGSFRDLKTCQLARERVGSALPPYQRQTQRYDQPGLHLCKNAPDHSYLQEETEPYHAAAGEL